MDWSKQAETMTQTWSDAQKKMWESWFDLAKMSPGNDNNTPFTFYTNMLKQWQEMTGSGVQNWMAGADPTARNMAQQMLMSQQSMMSFMQTMTQMWKTIGPKLEAGEDWQAALKDYASQWVNSMTNLPGTAMSANMDMSEMWKIYIDEWQNLGKFWTKSLSYSPPQRLGDLSSMLGGSSMLASISNFQWDNYEKMASSLTEFPSLGNNREINVKLLASFDNWVDLQHAVSDYRSSLAKTFTQAAEDFVKTLIEKGEKGEVIDSVQDLMNLWFETVDQAFTRMYVSEDYLKVQKNLAAAGMTYKMRQQEIIEMGMKALDLPTRSELDDAYKSLNDLRKEVKALKKEMKAMKETAATAPKPKAVAATKSQPKKTTTTKPRTTRRKATPTKTTAAKTAATKTTTAKTKTDTVAK